MEKTTHFGYQQVDVDKKQGLVKGVFDSVADNYDLMNDVMSMGTHHLWKNYTIASSNVTEGDKVLDIAGGTGDLAIKYREKVGPSGQVILSDINGSMLEEGRKNLLDTGLLMLNLSKQMLNRCPLKTTHLTASVLPLALEMLRIRMLPLSKCTESLKKVAV